MDLIDKTILSAIFAESLTKSDAIQIVKKKNFLSDDYIISRIENLVKNGLVEQDKKSLDGVRKNFS